MMSATALPIERQHAVRDSAVGVVGAVAAAVVVWAIASLAGAELSVRFGDGAPIDVTIVSVVAASLLGALAGWGLLAVLRRFTSNARTVWTAVAAVAALLSLSGPLSATATTGTKISLMAMHLAVAAVLIVVLRRANRP
jgi:hypothetical protein